MTLDDLKLNHFKSTADLTTNIDSRLSFRSSFLVDA